MSARKGSTTVMLILFFATRPPSDKETLDIDLYLKLQFRENESFLRLRVKTALATLSCKARPLVA